MYIFFFFFSSRRRHTRFDCDWSSDVCSSDLFDRERRAAGVMMIPIPRAGRLVAVRGQDAAEHVPGVEEIAITAHLGQELVPLPEGWQYLGFIFARGDSPEEVEQALRRAHAGLALDND